MKASLRTSLSTLIGSAVLLLAATSFADGEDCLNDTDCPGSECGSAVCNWNKAKPNPTNPDKPYTCNPAGTDPKGKDGWCSDRNSDFCKCKALGATCSSNTFYCTFTKPEDAPPGAAGGSASTGGASTGGASTGGSTGTAGSSVIGTAGTAPAGTGGTTGTAGTASTGTAGTKAAPAAEDEGGCSVSAPAGKSGAALGLGLLGMGYALLRRRRAR
jgi:MYXO-CTERM domain-containing protein